MSLNNVNANYGDSTYFLLIPGSNNKWGKARDVPIKGQGPSLWQSILQSEIENSQNSEFFCDISDMYQNYKPHGEYPDYIPYWTKEYGEIFCPDNSQGKKAIEILIPYCINASIDDEIPNKSISIISTSQGSSFTFDLLNQIPQLRAKIKNIVIYSPAFFGPGNKLYDGAMKSANKLINALQGIPTLFMETQHGFGRYDTPSANDPWGLKLRHYFDNEHEHRLAQQLPHDQIHFRLSIPTTQHSGDISKKSAFGGCKSFGASAFCDQFVPGKKECRIREEDKCNDVFSDDDYEYNLSKQNDIWELVHKWCETNDHSVIGEIETKIYEMRSDSF